MAKDQGPLSGFRDMLSDQTLARQQVLDVIKHVYELYGFMPIKTPAIERFETLNGKYGEEATTLMYEFEDRGGRHLALRYDHTVPLARLMATYGQSLPNPYKRYVVGDVWRGESPQAGRYREFTQIDADIVGSDSYLADVEILVMMHDVFKALKLNVTIEVNDRRILDGLAELCGITDQHQFIKLIGVIDKVSKIGPDAVLQEIGADFGPEAKAHVAKILATDMSFDDALAIVNNSKAKDGISNLKSIFAAFEPLSLLDIKFKPAIARGLNYYTSTIFETIINEQPGIGSVCSGGRYDKLIGQLGGPNSPAIGTSIGLDRLMDVISLLSKVDLPDTKTQVYIANLDDKLNSERLKIAQILRAASIPTELYFKEAKLGKQLESISKLGVAKVIIYGQQELDKNVVVVRDLKNSSQAEVPVSELTRYFSN